MMLEKNLTPSYVAEKKSWEKKITQTKSPMSPSPNPSPPPLKSQLFDPLEM